jgi:hypothetical protein
MGEIFSSVVGTANENSVGKILKVLDILKEKELGMARDGELECLTLTSKGENSYELSYSFGNSVYMLCKRLYSIFRQMCSLNRIHDDYMDLKTEV